MPIPSGRPNPDEPETVKIRSAFRPTGRRRLRRRGPSRPFPACGGRRRPGPQPTRRRRRTAPKCFPSCLLPCSFLITAFPCQNRAKPAQPGKTRLRGGGVVVCAGNNCRILHKLHMLVQNRRGRRVKRSALFPERRENDTLDAAGPKFAWTSPRSRQLSPTSTKE